MMFGVRSRKESNPTEPAKDFFGRRDTPEVALFRFLALRDTYLSLLICLQSPVFLAPSICFAIYFLSSHLLFPNFIHNLFFFFFSKKKNLIL